MLIDLVIRFCIWRARRHVDRSQWWTGLALKLNGGKRPEDFLQPRRR
jgi:hypothetical protein